MKLFRHGHPGLEQPGAIDAEGNYRDISAFGEDFNEAFFENNGLARLAEWWKTYALVSPVLKDGFRLGPCVARPSKIICVGLNYRKHAEETGAAIPEEPVLFFKSTTALCGPNDALILPRNSMKTDWEVELAVVIGKKASYINAEDAWNYIAGYTLHNDYSERAFQLERGGQWAKGKGCDTFAPMGPWLVTCDEIPNPHDLRLWLKVNGLTMQDASTSDFIFDVPTIVSYISQFMTLLPGDIISTGTPAGVGLGMKPEPVYLKAGDVVELGIDGLGSSRQEVRAF